VRRAVAACEDKPVGALLAGLLTGLSLIVAIGAQNAYVLRMGLSRQHVTLIVAICGISDIVLIVLGVAGVGGVIRSAPVALQILRWVGVVYLCLFAVRSFWRAFHAGVLLPSKADKPTTSAVVSTTLAFTFLNPHVYLDTVLLLGTIGNQYGHQRWFFALGASISSLLWFSGLGYGARFASRLMSRPGTWRALDCAIGVVMLAVAFKLTVTPLPS
jgi:L-lysine exporter family protein LysE/ArgO